MIRRATWALLALLVASLPAVVAAQPITQLSSRGTTGTITANGGAVQLTNTAGMASLMIQTTGTFNLTWELQCASDGTTFDADDEVPVTLMSSTPSAADSINSNANALYTANIAGCRAVQVIATAYTSGTMTVAMTAVPAGGSSGAGASGAVTADTELPAAGLLAASSVALPTTPIVGAAMYCYNGTTLDLCQSTRDPCDGAAKTVIPINIVTATTTELTPSLSGGSNYYYVCSINLGPTAGAQNFALVDDDSDNCASVTSGMAGGTTAGTGWNFAANGGLVLGNGQGTVLKTGGTNRVICAVTSAAVQISGVMTVVAAP